MCPSALYDYASGFPFSAVLLVVVRCVNKDYGAIGCAVDVLSFADSRCSGRSRCTITVADFSLRGIRPCPQDLTSYFEAGYRCVPGVYGLQFAVSFTRFTIEGPPKSSKMVWGTV